MKLAAAVLTDAGKVRKNNQDSCLFDEERGLMVVADGMGGHAAGEVASRLAVDVIRDQVARGLTSGTIPPGSAVPAHWSGETRLLAGAVTLANEAIFRASREKAEHRGMGTTVVAVLAGPRRLSVVHVGDSRLYLFRRGRLSLLTRDHTVVAEQLARGDITPAQAEASEVKNILSRALGVMDSVDVDASEPLVRNGDLFLSCTDGLTKMLSDHDIERALGGFLNPQDLCRRLVDQALERGGRDNVTVGLCAFTTESLWSRFLQRFKKGEVP